MSTAITTTGGSRSVPARGQELVQTDLEQVLADFESDPRIPQLLRRVAREHPVLFFIEAAKHLQSEHLQPNAESQACRFVADLLVRQESFFEWLADPGRCPFESAVHLFRCLLTVDPTSDFRLARMLPGRNDSTPHRVLRGAHAARAIDILDHTSPGQRLLSAIGHLPNSADARIAAKAALFVGRRVNNPAWIARQMSREDGRLRANAVEGVWGATSDEAIRILENCIGDTDNRVAGNALIGLHKAGRPGVAEQALAMSESEVPRRRATAAWAMGKMKNPAFIDRLTELLRDEHARVRSTAIRALVALGQEAKRLETAAAIARKKAAEPVALETVALETIVEESLPDPAETEVPDAPFEFKLDGSSKWARRR